MSTEAPTNNSGNGGGCGLSIIGMGIAALCSWTINHSILWAIIHGILGWIYVAWYALVHHFR